MAAPYTHIYMRVHAGPARFRLGGRAAFRAASRRYVAFSGITCRVAASVPALSLYQGHAAHAGPRAMQSGQGPRLSRPPALLETVPVVASFCTCALGPSLGRPAPFCGRQARAKFSVSSFVLLRWIPSSRWGRQPSVNSILHVLCVSRVCLRQWGPSAAGPQFSAFSFACALGREGVQCG